MTRKVKGTSLMILTTTLCFIIVMFVLVPLVNCPAEYDPWIDMNDDGKIDLKKLLRCREKIRNTNNLIAHKLEYTNSTHLFLSSGLVISKVWVWG